MLTNSFESCDKNVCFGTIQDFLPFDGGQVCPEGHAYYVLPIAIIVLSSNINIYSFV